MILEENKNKKTQIVGESTFSENIDTLVSVIPENQNHLSKMRHRKLTDSYVPL